MDDKLNDISERITKLDDTNTLAKRLRVSAKLKDEIGELEKELNTQLEKLEGLHEINNISEDSVDLDEDNIKTLTQRIETTKHKLEHEKDIEKRVELYTNLKLDIEQCKTYYQHVKMTVKNLN